MRLDVSPRDEVLSGNEHIEIIQRAAFGSSPSPADFAPLLESIGCAWLVLIGDATHGTHKFYRARAELTKALILDKGFNVVAVEADWPDAYRINRWVRHASAHHLPSDGNTMS